MLSNIDKIIMLDLGCDRASIHKGEAASVFKQILLREHKCGKVITLYRGSNLALCQGFPCFHPGW